MEPTNTEKLNALPQRKKKYAKTKTGLLQALIDLLREKPLAEITVKELTARAGVSTPTFFNYFDSKPDMLIYFIQMWSVQMNAIAQASEATSRSYLDAIREIFRQSSRTIAVHHRLMQEIIVFQARETIGKVHEITEGEKWAFFPEIEGVETMKAAGLESILPPLIHKAVAAGELSVDTHTELFFLMLSSLFFGTSILLLKKNPEHFAELFEAEIDQIIQFYRGQK